MVMLGRKESGNERAIGYVDLDSPVGESERPGISAMEGQADDVTTRCSRHLGFPRHSRPAPRRRAAARDFQFFPAPSSSFHQLNEPSFSDLRYPSMSLHL